MFLQLFTRFLHPRSARPEVIVKEAAIHRSRVEARRNDVQVPAQSVFLDAYGEDPKLTANRATEELLGFTFPGAYLQLSDSVPVRSVDHPSGAKLDYDEDGSLVGIQLLQSTTSFNPFELRRLIGGRLNPASELLSSLQQKGLDRE